MPSDYQLKPAVQRLLRLAIGFLVPADTKGTSYQVHRLLVLMGLLLAVLPAAFENLLWSAFLLIIAVSRHSNLGVIVFLLPLIVGWWALYSLVRVFLYLLKGDPVPGLATWLGIVAGSAAAIAFHWPGIIDGTLLTKSNFCVWCVKSRIRPSLLCVLVGVHWAFLCRGGFRLTARTSVTPVASVDP